MHLEGTQLGHYRLTRFIQGGGMGEVYLAEDLTLSRQVAIKVMKAEPVLYPDAQNSKDAARLFQREMRAISMLDHAHILTLLEAGEQRISHDNITYMVMPYCPEGSLADWIRRYHSTKPLSPNEVAQVLQQAADALQYAHDQQILHLDVKPSNFLVRRQQDPSQLPNLLLADFGVAKMATTSKLSGTVRGTLEYMAPEQLAGTPVAASDQYALGIMIYELLTGHTPFQGTLPQAIPHMHANVNPKPPSALNPSLPSTLDTIVLRALAKKPQDRFASVKEFASAFAGALKPNAAQPSGAKKTPSRTTAPDIIHPSPIKPVAKAEQAALYTKRPLSINKPQPPKHSFLWALVIGVVAGVLTIGSRFAMFYLPYPPYGLFEIYAISLPLLILWVTGLVTGKLTRQRRMSWISGITPVIVLAAYISIDHFYFLKYRWQEFLILAPICGLISFGGASFATRKRRK